MWSRVELKEDSKTLLRLNYWPFVLVAFIHMAVSGGGVLRETFNFTQDDYDFYDIEEYLDHIGAFGHRLFHSWGPFAFRLLSTMMAAMLCIAFVFLILNIFVFHPLEVGCKRYMVMAREVKPQFGEMVFAFSSRCYLNIVKTTFLMGLFTYLWSLLFVIPGIVKAYEYRMIPYLLAEYPDMAPSEAFRISKEMMMGNKWEAFVLDISFIGWNLLTVITVGITGIFYAWPYQMLTDAALYLTLKKTNPAFGYEKPDINFYL